MSTSSATTCGRAQVGDGRPRTRPAGPAACRTGTGASAARHTGRTGPYAYLVPVRRARGVRSRVRTGRDLNVTFGPRCGSVARDGPVFPHSGSRDPGAAPRCLLDPAAALARPRHPHRRRRGPRGRSRRRDARRRPQRPGAGPGGRRLRGLRHPVRRRHRPLAETGRRPGQPLDGARGGRGPPDAGHRHPGADAHRRRGDRPGPDGRRAARSDHSGPGAEPHHRQGHADALGDQRPGGQGRRARRPHRPHRPRWPASRWPPVPTDRPSSRV